MGAKTVDRWLWLVFSAGVTLIVVGWVIDYRSAGDPHFWDSIGWGIAAVASLSLASRPGRPLHGLHSKLVSLITPMRAFAGLLFASVLTFTTLCWHYTSVLAFRSADSDLADSTAAMLRSITSASYTFLLPLLGATSILALIVFCLTFRDRNREGSHA